MLDFKSKIREISDFPEKGVSFKDITPLLEDPKYFCQVVKEMARPFQEEKIDKVVGIDARGFILAAGVAYELGKGLSIVRKKGKLPYKTVSREYALEYGKNTLEMHRDSIRPREKVLIVDDVLATGGTVKAALDLVEKLGGKVAGISLLVDLAFLKGRERLKGYKVYSLVAYE